MNPVHIAQGLEFLAVYMRIAGRIKLANQFYTEVDWWQRRSEENSDDKLLQRRALEIMTKM